MPVKSGYPTIKCFLHVITIFDCFPNLTDWPGWFIERFDVFPYHWYVTNLTASHFKKYWDTDSGRVKKKNWKQPSDIRKWFLELWRILDKIYFLIGHLKDFLNETRYCRFRQIFSVAACRQLQNEKWHALSITDKK